jgi:LPS export ABC transporter protein LptC
MKSRLLLLMLFLGVVAIAVGWIYQSSVAPVMTKEARLIRDDIDYFLTNLHYRELNADGELSFQFQSPRLEHYPLNDVSSIELPSMQIYTESDPWLVDSLNGEYQHASNRLHLTRQVVMQRRGDSPMQVYGESIHFEPDIELITADEEILMVSPQGRVKAERGVFDLARGVYRLSRARGVYNHEDS